MVGVGPSTHATRSDSSKRVLTAFLQDGCSKRHNGGGLRTRVEVTHRS